MTTRSCILRAARIGARLHRHDKDRPVVRASSAPDGTMLDLVDGHRCWHVLDMLPTKQAEIATAVADVLHENEWQYRTSPLGKAELRRFFYGRGFSVRYIDDYILS